MPAQPAQHFRVGRRTIERLRALSNRTRVPAAVYLRDAVEAVLEQGAAGKVTFAPRLVHGVLTGDDVVCRINSADSRRLGELAAELRTSKCELARAGLHAVLEREGA